MRQQSGVPWKTWTILQVSGWEASEALAAKRHCPKSFEFSWLPIKTGANRFEQEGRTSHQPEVPKLRTSQPSIKNQVATKLSSGDVKGAMRLLASTDKIQYPSPEVVKRLKEKHPKPLIRAEIPNPGELNEFQPCSMEEVKKAISTFKPGLSGGPDGLQPQHLKDLTSEVLGEPSTILLDKISRLLNEILFEGRVPEEVCKVLYGANLTALSKPDGGTRPIAVGTV